MFKHHKLTSRRLFAFPRLDFLPFDNLRDKCIYSAQCRERSSGDNERKIVAAREHPAVLLQRIHHSSSIKLHDAARQMYVGTANQSNVDHCPDVLPSVTPMSLHLAERVVARQRGLSVGLSLRLLRNGLLLHC